MIDVLPFTSATYPSLTYGRKPFPAVVLDGKPWWSTAHVQHALGYGFRPYECQVFTPVHVGAHCFDFDSEDEASHVISTLAAQQLVEKWPDRRANKMLGGWLRKRDHELRTAAPEQPGTLFVVRESKPHPERPLYASVVQREWELWHTAYNARFAPPAPIVAPGSSALVRPQIMPSAFPPAPRSSFEPDPEVRRRVTELGVAYRRQLREAREAREARGATPLNLADYSQ